MKLVDFSSLIQLGVGLHAGTAFLQFVSEFANVPLSKKLQRLHNIIVEKSKKNEAYREMTEGILDLISDLDLKIVQIFNEYKVAVIINILVAAILTALLVWASFCTETVLSLKEALVISFVSILPAPTSVFALWIRWRRNTSSLSGAARKMEKRVSGFEDVRERLA